MDEKPKREFREGRYAAGQKDTRSDLPSHMRKRAIKLFEERMRRIAARNTIGAKHRKLP